MTNVAQPFNKTSGMPQMGRAFAGWTKPVTLQKITQTIVNGFNVDTPTSITFAGTVQPLSPKALMLKPDGERGWEWLQIHCFSGRQNLDVGDIVVFNAKTYKIMAQNDYSLNGFIEYHLVANYSP